MNNIIIILLVVIAFLAIMIFGLVNLKFNFLYDKIEYLHREQKDYDELLQTVKKTFDLNQSLLEQYQDCFKFLKEEGEINSDRFLKILKLMGDLSQIIPNQITDLQNELKEQNNKDNE